MTDRVYPSGNKPSAPNGTANPSFPATKAQLYNATRPAYRPQPLPRRRRSRCCCCCLFTTAAILLLLLLAGIASAVFYVVYRPKRPSFSLSSLHVSTFNLSATSPLLTSKLNLTVIARNPNKKISFLYDAVSISTYFNGVHVSDGNIPQFKLSPKNTTALKSTISGSNSIGDDDVAKMRSDLKKKNKSMEMKIVMDTKVRAKIGGSKTKRLRVRVVCDEIKIALPIGKGATTTAKGGKCDVDLRIKIWKWTF